VPYVTAGHPSPDETLALLSGLEDAGADVIDFPGRQLRRDIAARAAERVR